MRRILLLGLVAAFVLTGSASGNPASQPSPAQALRMCVDRWNQGNMLGWGPTLVSISVRRLDRREQEHVGIYDRKRRCTVSLAPHAPRHLGTRCSGGAVMPGHPKYCVYTNTTFVCVINQAGGYECSRYADGAPPLRNKNATTDLRGVLALDVPLRGTHVTPPLSWQRRYPHIDGFIHPWTSASRLRPGLKFDQSPGAQRYRGTCVGGSEYADDQSAIRCYFNGWFDPCFAPTKSWNRPGLVVACANAGFTTFARFTITKRSA